MDRLATTPVPDGITTNTISGKILLAEAQVGIPNLLVVLYDADPGTKAEEQVATFVASESSIGTAMNGLGDRIGSVLTDIDGAFNLSYHDGEFRIRNEGEKRPDLVLLVFAPEMPGKPLNELLLFASPHLRQSAGRTESYFIQLRAEDLKKAGLPIPQDRVGTEDPAGEADLAVFEGKLKAGKQFFDKKSAILRQHVETEHAQHVVARTTGFTKNVKEELSRVPKSVRESAFFVAEGESIQTKVLGNTREHIRTTFNSPPEGKKPIAHGFVYLTEQQIADYQQFIQGDEFVLPAEVVERDILPSLYRGSPAEGSANDFLMDHPAVRACMRVIKGDITCDGHDHDEEEEEEEGEGNGGGGPILLAQPADPPPAEVGDELLYLARQMQHVTAPEGVLNFGVDGKERPTPEQVGEHITGLRLEKGPADSPSFFDFHTLHIAFDHVWKEATDQGVLQHGEALYDEVVGTGHQPTGLKNLLLNVSSTIRFLKNEPQREQPVPPTEVIFEFPEAVSVWAHMSANERNALIKLTHAMLGKYREVNEGNTTWKDFLTGKDQRVPFIDKGHLLDRNGFEVISVFRQKGQRILDTVYERVEQSTELKSDFERYRKADELANTLNQALKQQYSFTYFAADATERSINFGVLLTYRQKWDPVAYQAGELVRTIPLAPKEVRKYTKRTVVKKSRSHKEIEDNLRITKTDTSELSRAESEIMNKAFNKSTFALNSTSTFDIPLSDKIKIGNTVTTNFTNEAQRESNQTKKDFRESVVKAAQEYKNERRVEITTESSTETEDTESGEITNPNDELTVTYLFYELQRQYRVNERLHRMRPVVLVAQEMPAPHEIDDDWIVRHDWMLKRALMDDSFVYAFECVVSIRGDKLMLGEFERTVLEQRKIVRDLRQNVRFYTDETGRMSRLMQAAINKEADVSEDRDFWDGIPLIGSKLDAAESAIKGVGNLLGMGQGDDPKEAARIRREGIKDAYERADRERRELMGRLEHETGVLNGLTRQVAEKRKEINEKEICIARLKNHLKDHILHYMQAIWSYEHPDQRFFRLFNTKVPQLKAPAASYNIRIKTVPLHSAALDAVVNLGKEGSQKKVRHVFSCAPQIEVEEKTLAEVAELDNLLGFKGNYMIFPLRKSNVLTDFMMAPYVDSEFGLLDPDAPGNWTLEEFQQLYCCLKEELGDQFSEVEPALKEFYRQLLLDPLRPGELIMVPTGSLFIEALPGEHPVLEDFKALHRAVDVKKVQAEVRRLELENVRYAARILAGERNDPDIDKKVVVKGTGVLVNPDPA
jgi:hypothetical protein